MQNEYCHGERCQNVSSLQKPVQPAALQGEVCYRGTADTQQYGCTAPDVGGKVRGIRFQCIAFCFLCNAPEHCRAVDVHHQGDDDDHEGPHIGLHMQRFGVIAGEAFDCFHDNPAGRNEQQQGFCQCGETFDTAMPIGVLGICRACRHLYSKVGAESRQHIQGAVQGFGENAQRACYNAHHKLHDGEQGAP